MSASDKVHYIGKTSENKEPQETPVQNDTPTQQAAQAQDLSDTRRDMSKVALFVSLLAVVLLVVFFFGLNQNLKGMSANVDQLTGRMSGLEEKVVALENLPHQSKMMVMGTMLQEMAQRAAYMSTQMETEAQNEKLVQAMELLQQVQTEIAPE